MARDEESDRLVAAWWRNCEVCDECKRHPRGIMSGHAPTCSRYARPTWDERRRIVADKWFEGDGAKAEQVLELMLDIEEYGSWETLDEVMKLIKPSTDNIESERR